MLNNAIERTENSGSAPVNSNRERSGKPGAAVRPAIRNPTWLKPAIVILSVAVVILAQQVTNEARALHRELDVMRRAMSLGLPTKAPAMKNVTIPETKSPVAGL